MNTLSPGLVWLVILIVLIVIELMTMGLTTIWFAAGAFVAIFVALLGGPVWIQILIFLIVSILLLYYTRPIATRYFNKGREKTNVESLIGRECVVIHDIDNIQGTGTVKINGMEWTARAVKDVKIPADAVVVVRAISGVKVVVEEVKEQN